MADLLIETRNANLVKTGDVLDYTSLKWSELFMAVGGWMLDIHPNSPAVDALLEPGAGIVVRDPVTLEVVMSGPVGTPHREVGEDSKGERVDKLTISGPDDMVWIGDRLAHPVPSGAPLTTQAYDTRTGICSSVLLAYIAANCGPAAGIVSRRVAPMAFASDPAAGTVVTGQARWQNLLVLLGELAVQGGASIGCRQQGTQLVVTAWANVDRSDEVAFGLDLGNLDAANYDLAPPTATAIYAGGQGEGTARTIVETVTAGAVRRIEKFVDRRDLAVTAELTAAANVALTDAGSSASLKITPADQGIFRYGSDYRLGDLVRVDVDGGTVVDRVTSSEVTLDDTGVTRTVNVGAGTTSTTAALFDGLRQASRRLALLERR